VSPAELLLANAALLAGAVVQGAVGFGAMLVAVPFLLLIDPEIVPGSALVASVPLGVFILARDHRHGRGVLFGVLLLAAVLASASRWTVAPTDRNGFLAGTISGFSGTTVGVGGPPVAIVYQGDAGPVLRANLSRYFLAGLVISLTSLSIGGELGPDRVQAGLTLVPGLLVGAVISGRVAQYLDRGWARPAVLAVSAASAVVVLARALQS
jgi:uncharacterized membrane protein YfcA